MNAKPEKPRKMSRASYLLGIDLDQLKSHKDAAGAALDLEPHSNKIADMLSGGVPPATILKIVSARLDISHHVAARAIQICLNGTGIDFKLPRGHRPKKTGLGDDLQHATSAAPPAPAPTVSQPQGAKKEVAQPPAPAVKQAPTPAPVSPSAPPSPVPFPDIPRGELTHTERAEIAKKWIDAQFGGRHPTQVTPDELSPEAQAWMEKLWDKPAPVNPKTGQPYAFKRFTGDGRPTYDEPWWPPEAVPMENSEKGYLPVHDTRTRDLIKKYGLRLIATNPRLMEIRDKNGKYQVGGFWQDDAPCLVRSVRDIDYAIQGQIKNGIAY